MTIFKVIKIFFVLKGFVVVWIVVDIIQNAVFFMKNVKKWAKSEKFVKIYHSNIFSTYFRSEDPPHTQLLNVYTSEAAYMPYDGYYNNISCREI